MLGKILGKVAGGFLDKLGLGGMSSFVKLGLNALTGNWAAVAKDVFSMVSNFRGDFLNKAAKQPPLGGFQSAPNSQQSPLSSNRITELIRGLGGMFGGLSNLSSQGLSSGMKNILGAFNLLQNTFSNSMQYDSRAATSLFQNMRM